jgi:hypothetical protein
MAEQPKCVQGFEYCLECPEEASCDEIDCIYATCRSCKEFRPNRCAKNFYPIQWSCIRYNPYDYHLGMNLLLAEQ